MGGGIVYCAMTDCTKGLSPGEFWGAIGLSILAVAGIVALSAWLAKRF